MGSPKLKALHAESITFTTNVMELSSAMAKPILELKP